MGVDIALLIPTKVRSIRDHKDCVQCLDDTIAQIERYFHGKKHFVGGRYVERENEDLLSQFSPDELTSYSFSTPFLDNSVFELCNGAWCVTNGYRYIAYFYKYKDEHSRWRSWLREIAFDVARMLGRKDIWLCGDLLASTFFDDDGNSSFERWKEYCDEGIPSTVFEFDFTKSKDVNDKGFPDWEKYHDSFKECFELLQEYQERFPQYEILTIHPIGGYILLADGDDIFLVNPDTGKRLTYFPIDGIKQYDNDSVTIYHGDNYAKFDFTGKQIQEKPQRFG